MTDASSGSTDTPVVTLRSLRPPLVEGAAGLEAGIPMSETVDRFNQAVEKLAEETNKTGADVLITVQDRDASLLQSQMAEREVPGAPLPSGGTEAKFGEGLTGGDWWGWIRSVFDHIDKSQWHPILRPPDEEPSRFADAGRVVVLGDWGTNLYGAPVSAESIKRVGGYELLVHLGDIYYSGTNKEVKQRFLAAWPMAAGKVSRALNGNHEMYSGGQAYFENILPAFNQPSSYFAMRNSHWLMVGLDTAHTDHSLDDRQAAWVRAVAEKAGERKVILFSHHQPFSRLDAQGPKLQAALGDLLQQKKITAWYWGHEHACIIYDKHAHFGLLGRCIGHGGIPAPRKSAVTGAPDACSLYGVTWKRLAANANSPSCLALDGSNPLVKGEEEKFGPHGYLTLEFAGPNLTERVYLPDGTEIYDSPVA
jgi:hypothetical protein